MRRSGGGKWAMLAVSSPWNLGCREVVLGPLGSLANASGRHGSAMVVIHYHYSYKVRHPFGMAKLTHITWWILWFVDVYGDYSYTSWGKTKATYNGGASACLMSPGVPTFPSWKAHITKNQPARTPSEPRGTFKSCQEKYPPGRIIS